MKRWRLIALGFITALMLLIWNRAPWDMQPQATKPTLQLSAKAQSPEDSPEAEVEVTPEDFPEAEVEVTPGDFPEAEVEVTPGDFPEPEVEATPDAFPEPEVEATPEAFPQPEVEASPDAFPEPEVKVSPSPEVVASPKVSPAPEAVISPKASPTNEQFKAVTLPLGGELYQESRFEIGVLEGYKVSQVGGVPLIESADGNLAYTVVVKPQLNVLPFSNEALAELAIEEFERGEGFQPGELRANAPSVVSLSWSGTLTQGRNSQPITGEILARQSGRNIFLLLIAATEDKASEVGAALVTLSDSLNPL